MTRELLILLGEGPKSVCIMSFLWNL